MRSSCPQALAYSLGPCIGAADATPILTKPNSCAPNASVAFGGAPNAPATARIVALREVAAGEEIVHSYVDCRLSKRVRAEGLAIYGIRCQCARCVGGDA